MSDPFILAVANRKGGTGKSTTAVNLAAEFAARGWRTLVIDLDTQGHAGVGFGLRGLRDTASVHRLFRQPDFDLRQAVRPTGVDHVWLAPADPNFEEPGQASGGDADPQVLARALAALGGEFDRVVLDTPPSLGVALLAALAATDGVVVPLVPHHLAAEGVRQLARLILRVKSMVNPKLRMLGLLPMQADRRINLHRQVLGDLTRQFGAERLFGGIRTDIRLAEAFAAAQPVRLFAPRSRGALDYHLLAEELCRLCQWTPPVAASGAEAAAPAEETPEPVAEPAPVPEEA